jgi:hypothetical protein
MAKEKRICYSAAVDDARKYAILCAATILVARLWQTLENSRVLPALPEMS